MGISFRNLGVESSLHIIIPKKLHSLRKKYAEFILGNLFMWITVEDGTL